MGPWSHHWFKSWCIAYSLPSQCLTQWWLAINTIYIYIYMLQYHSISMATNLMPSLKIILLNLSSVTLRPFRSRYQSIICKFSALPQYSTSHRHRFMQHRTTAGVYSYNMVYRTTCRPTCNIHEFNYRAIVCTMLNNWLCDKCFSIDSMTL